MPVTYPEGQERIQLPYRTTVSRRADLKKFVQGSDSLNTFGDILIAYIDGEPIEITESQSKHTVNRIFLKFFVPIEVHEAIHARAAKAGQTVQQFLDVLFFGSVVPRKNAAKKTSVRHRVTFIIDPVELDVINGLLAVEGLGEDRNESAKRVYMSHATAVLESHFRENGR